MNGHVDALGVALLIAALLAWQRERAAAAGALVGGGGGGQAAAGRGAPRHAPAANAARGRDRRRRAGAALRRGRPAHGRQPRRVQPALARQRRRLRALYAPPNGLVAHTRFAGRYDMVGVAAAGAPDDRRDRDSSFPTRSPASSRALWAGADLSRARGVGAVATRSARCAWPRWRIGAFVLLTPALHPGTSCGCCRSSPSAARRRGWCWRCWCRSAIARSAGGWPAAVARSGVDALRSSMG